MTSRYGNSRTYGRSNKADKTSLNFDKMLKSESKPSTARVSMKAVHRWGNTSYTSIRKANGDVDKPVAEVPQSKRQKVTRVNSPVPEPPIPSSLDPFDFEAPNGKTARNENKSAPKVPEPAPKRNKFFKSRNLFDSLKNGPTFNDDSIKYNDGSKTVTNADAIPEPIKSFEPIVKEELPLPPPSPPLSPEIIKEEIDVKVEEKSSESSTTGKLECENIEESNCVSAEPSVELKSVVSESVLNPSTSSRPVKKFFMNRQKKSSNSPSKSPSKAYFKMKLWEQDDDLAKEETKTNEHSSQPSVISDNFSEDFQDVTVPLLRKVKSEPARPGHEAVTSVHCDRTQKPLYTVVRNVKQAHQCHESGETQEFNDDIDYLIDSLEKYNSTGTRCLGALSLATKCMIPSFRMHLRAHGTIPKLFRALQDAPSDPNVAFCSATLMFVLSQDRLNMDLDSSMLELMLHLLETNTQVDMSQSGISSKELMKNKAKVRDVCEQMQQKSHAKHLHLDHITTGELAMETLLTLTSKRAGEWFKEEIRELGGLDHILNTVIACSTMFKDPQPDTQLNDSDLEKLSKVSRCFRVLENVCHQNVDNQMHLISLNNSSLVDCVMRLLRTCSVMFPSHNASELDDITTNATHPGVTLFNCLQSTLRVLVNLTNNNATTSAQIGQVPGIIQLGLHCVLQLPKYVPQDKKFDLCVLSLGMLINLMETCEANRKVLMETDAVISSFDGDELRAPAIEALVQLFTEKFEEARQSEEQTDKLLDDTEEQCEAKAANDKDACSSQQANAANDDDIEETLMKALKKAGKHMEHSIVGAYTALLVGFVIQDNQDYTDEVREHLPEGNYKLMAKLLRTLYNFMILTVAPGNTGVQTVKQILDVLDAS